MLQVTFKVSLIYFMCIYKGMWLKSFGLFNVIPQKCFIEPKQMSSLVLRSSMNFRDLKKISQQCNSADKRRKKEKHLA